MLTDAQMTTLAAAIRASTDPTVVAALSIRNDVALTDWCNSDSTFVVWKTKATQDELMSLSGFEWAQIDNLTTGQAGIWEWLFSNNEKAINPSKSQIRAGISECWKGTAAKVAVATAVLDGCKRFASMVESMFATGTGTNAIPGALIVTGPVSLTEVSTALNRNP